MKEIYIKRNLKLTKQGQGFYCSQVFQINGGLDKPVKQALFRNNEPVYTLENKEDAIPKGRYPILRDFKGKFQHAKIAKVKGRSNIEIHEGNFLRSTKGCLLFGQSYHEERTYENEDLIIANSKSTCVWLINDFFLNDEERKMTRKASQDEIIGFITID